MPSTFRLARPLLTGAAFAGMGLGTPAAAQHAQHDAARHAAAPAAPSAAGLGGQAAFVAITEVVKLLLADSTTDWSKVDLERLRQHLIDMDEVTLRAEVTQTAVPGGLRMEIRGTGRTRTAIRAMVRDHAAMMQSETSMRSVTAESADGAVVAVTAADARDTRTAQRIRALGFIGWLTLQDHHMAHHVALARGTIGAHRH